MNPYDFVHMDWDHPVDRKSAAPHNLFTAGSLTGRLLATITALRPIFIPDPRYKTSPQRFLTSGATQKPVIPASTLKGLFRGVVETVAPGCWLLFEGEYEKRSPDRVDYSRKLPSDYQPCQNIARLCPACRLFGMLGNPKSVLGKVCLEDAECREPKPHAAVYTPILAGPKPHHSAWYLNEGRVAGRKYYFHHPAVHISHEATSPGSRKPLDHYITPLDEGSRFEFSATFANVSPEEWSVLLYALVLEAGMRHKVGNAKSAGLGSVEVRATRIELVDVRDRYRGGAKALRVIEGGELESYLAEQTRHCVSKAAPVTLRDLRRIWAWPPAAGVAYRYPGQEWFEGHPGEPISAT